MLTIAGGLTIFGGLSLRCVENQKVISTQQINNVRNAINWKSIIEGNMTAAGLMREPEAVERIEALLKAAPISTCPYTRIFVKLAHESAPILTFEEDGYFSQYSQVLPCAGKNILFLTLLRLRIDPNNSKTIHHVLLLALILRSK